jgi:hypothetical protein
MTYREGHCVTDNSFDDTQDVAACALERMPHMAKKITLMWCSRELDAFIPKLIMDSRDGARQGLPMDVAAELLFLVGVNKSVRAIDLAQKTKINFGEAYRLIEKGDLNPNEASNPWADPMVAKDAGKITPRSTKAQTSRPAARATKPKGFLSRLFGD